MKPFFRSSPMHWSLWYTDVCGLLKWKKVTTVTSVISWKHICVYFDIKHLNCLSVWFSTNSQITTLFHSNNLDQKMLKKNHVKFSYFSGMMKCNKDQSSFREFCKGVPVIRRRWLDLKSIKVLYRRESSFFKRWASSTPMNAQFRPPRNDFKKMDEGGHVIQTHIA